jgi:hypothetical protein
MQAYIVDMIIFIRMMHHELLEEKLSGTKRSISPAAHAFIVLSRSSYLDLPPLGPYDCCSSLTLFETKLFNLTLFENAEMESISELIPARILLSRIDHKKFGMEHFDFSPIYLRIIFSTRQFAAGNDVEGKQRTRRFCLS